MTELDGVYVSERLRLASTVSAAAAGAWARLLRERPVAIATVVDLVQGGQAQAVALVDGYMAAKRAEQGRGPDRTKGLDATRYTIAALRRRPAEEVYARPFGALGGQLAEGTEFAAARGSGMASVGRLARTDLQLAQTHAARDWMADEPAVVGYRRVLGPGDNCALCVAASSRLYKRQDLMPIHERCSCTVAPVFGDHPVPTDEPDSAVRVADDPELGPRLLDEGWAA